MFLKFSLVEDIEINYISHEYVAEHPDAVTNK